MSRQTNSFWSSRNRCSSQPPKRCGTKPCRLEIGGAGRSASSPWTVCFLLMQWKHTPQLNIYMCLCPRYDKGMETNPTHDALRKNTLSRQVQFVKRPPQQMREQLVGHTDRDHDFHCRKKICSITSRLDEKTLTDCKILCRS